MNVVCIFIYENYVIRAKIWLFIFFPHVLSFELVQLSSLHAKVTTKDI